MLFETNIKDLLQYLPARKLHREKQKVRELLAQKRRIMPVDERTIQSTKILEQIDNVTLDDDKNGYNKILNNSLVILGKEVKEEFIYENIDSWSRKDGFFLYRPFVF